MQPPKAKTARKRSGLMDCMEGQTIIIEFVRLALESSVKSLTEG